eukprot:3597694-Prymnesium_polylepis.1
MLPFLSPPTHPSWARFMSSPPPSPACGGPRIPCAPAACAPSPRASPRAFRAPPPRPPPPWAGPAWLPRPRGACR